MHAVGFAERKCYAYRLRGFGCGSLANYLNFTLCLKRQVICICIFYFNKILDLIRSCSTVSRDIVNRLISDSFFSTQVFLLAIIVFLTRAVRRTKASINQCLYSLRH